MTWYKKAALKDEGTSTPEEAPYSYERDNTTIAPRPWRVHTGDGDCWGILDANGNRVVETDSGYYPPNIATAEFIVKCVNAHKDEA